MRVRVLRQCYLESTRRAHMPGDVIDLSDEQVNGLLSSGLVMEDKSLNGADEIKDNLYWCVHCGRSHQRDSKIGRKHAQDESQ